MLFHRPGVRTSEFAVMVITVAVNLINASAHWVGWRDAAIATLGAVAYIISRGLAKTEPRTPVVEPVPTPVAPPPR